VGYLNSVTAPPDNPLQRPIGARAGNEPDCGALDILHDLPPSEQAAVLRTVVDALPDAVIVHRLDGEVLFFSRGACVMLGYTLEQMSALGPFGWITPEAAEGGDERTAILLEKGAFDFESEAMCADGSTIPTDVSTRKVDGEGGPIVVAVLRDISDRKKAEARLVHLAFHDALTGLSNRAALDERLRVSIADSRRHHDMLGLAYIDLDNFKPVNDAYGHEIGDQVLVTIGERLSESIREQDLVSRIGGDEFVVVLPRLKSTGELARVAERLLAEIRRPVEACGYECAIDASIGFALFDTVVDDARTLVVKADVAMYAAKRDPLSPWLLWDESMGMTFPR